MINLMFCGNSKVFDGMIISLLSIVKYTNEPLNVFVLTMDLRNVDENYAPIEEKHIEILENIIKEKNGESKITLIDTTDLIKKEVLSSVNKKTHYTPYIFIRLFSDKIKELPDKILYLDCDIVCYKDIKEIFDIDIEEYDMDTLYTDLDELIDFLKKWNDKQTHTIYEQCNTRLILSEKTKQEIMDTING